MEDQTTVALDEERVAQLEKMLTIAKRIGAEVVLRFEDESETAKSLIIYVPRFLKIGTEAVEQFTQSLET